LHSGLTWCKMASMKLPSAIEADILRLLIARGESYGLALVKASDGRLSRGTVYVTLDRMEEKGFVESWTEGAPPPDYIGIRRRIYRPTGAGVRALDARDAAANVLAEPELIT
jgi:DNA-binding PadR family transcriptional regulator